MISFRKNNLPFFISLTDGNINIIGGVCIKEGFKLESLAWSKLPLDVIQKGEIVEKDFLVKTIKELLARTQPKKITSSFCYLNLTDEIVFSKFFTLPKVREEELESTVCFKIKDFLPQKPEETYLDWQPLDVSDGKQRVGVVAVAKKIIDGYLEVLGKLGLFPLGFEPESVSLARLAAVISPEANLTIFFSSQKATLSFNERGIVLLATTISAPSTSNAEQKLITELSKTARYWQSQFEPGKKIKNVFLAGTLKNETLLQETVKENFGVNLKKLPLPIIIPPDFPQNRLIELTPLFGLALRQKKSDSESKKIDLLPRAVKKTRREFAFKNKVSGVMKLFSFICWLIIGVYFFVYLSMFFELEKTNASLSGWEKVIYTPGTSELEKKAVEFNQKLLCLSKALKKRKLISETLLTFSDQIPPGILISSFYYEAKGGKIEIKGLANNRENILVLDKSLSKLGQVTVPLASFEESEQPQFSITLKLK